MPFLSLLTHILNVKCEATNYAGISDIGQWPGVPRGQRGLPGTTIGEVVFATGMVGFEETLTDPSYYGQIITQTYPLIGNYGMNSEDVSTKIWAKGYIVREACKTPPTSAARKRWIPS